MAGPGHFNFGDGEFNIEFSEEGETAAIVAALSTFYPNEVDPLDAHQVSISIDRLIAKFPTIAAYAHKHSIGHPFLYPDNTLGYVENFLRMMFGTPCEEFVADPVIVRAIDVLLILHADHEQNCSTSTVRVVGSSHANIFAAMCSGINALWGPRHGGANQEVVEMLEQIAEEGLTAQQFVDGAAAEGCRIDQPARPMPERGFFFPPTIVSGLLQLLQRIDVERCRDMVRQRVPDARDRREQIFG